MPTPQQVLSDPNFQALPISERLKVMRSVDPNFAGLSENDQALVLNHPHPSVPIWEQPLSPAGLAQTIGETGKGFLKGAARDIYGTLEGAGPLGMAAHYAAEKTGLGNKIRAATEPSNTPQSIGNVAETAAMLLPGAEAIGPKMATAGTALKGAAKAAAGGVRPLLTGINPLEHPFKILPDLVDAAGNAIRGGKKAVEDARLARILADRYSGPVMAPPKPLLPPEVSSRTASSVAPFSPTTITAPPGVDAKAFAQLPPNMQEAILKTAAARARGQGYTPPPAGTAPTVGGLTAPKPVHEAAHAIDTHFSPRKAMNLTRHLQEQGVPFEEVQAMVNKAKAPGGNWDAINAIEKQAWESGKALEASGAAKPGALVPKTPYRPKTADYSGIEGIENTEGTWDRVLKAYPRRPAITPQLTAPQPMGMLPPPAWPPQPPVPNLP